MHVHYEKALFKDGENAADGTMTRMDLVAEGMSELKSKIADIPFVAPELAAMAGNMLDAMQQRNQM